MAKANEFTHILRIQNTNVEGKRKVMFALRVIKGVGRRFSNLVLKIAQIDLNKRAGELTEQEIEKINDIFAKPTGKYLYQWFLVTKRTSVSFNNPFQ